MKEHELLGELEKSFGFFRQKTPLLKDYKKKSEYLAAKYQLKHYGSPLGESATDTELLEIWKHFDNTYIKNVKQDMSFVYEWANGSDEDVLRKDIGFLRIKDAVDLISAYKSVSTDEPPIVSKNLTSFTPIFTINSDEIIGELGLFNDDQSIYLVSMEEICVYKLFDSIYVFLEFLVASHNLKKPKRGNGINYSKEELIILDNLNKSQVYPIVKVNDVTIFT